MCGCLHFTGDQKSLSMHSNMTGMPISMRKKKPCNCGGKCGNHKTNSFIDTEQDIVVNNVPDKTEHNLVKPEVKEDVKDFFEAHKQLIIIAVALLIAASLWSRS